VSCIRKTPSVSALQMGRVMSLIVFSVEMSHHKPNNSRNYGDNKLVLFLNLKGSKLITLSLLPSQCQSRISSLHCIDTSGKVGWHLKLEFKWSLFHKFVGNILTFNS
jgi:hypothetical protein